MPKTVYIGINNVPRKAKKMYIGINGVARKIRKAYIGINGVARKFFSVLDPEVLGTTIPISSYSPDGGCSAFGNYAFFAGNRRSEQGENIVEIVNTNHVANKYTDWLTTGKWGCTVVGTTNLCYVSGGYTYTGEGHGVTAFFDIFDLNLAKKTSVSCSSNERMSGASIGGNAFFAGGDTWSSGYGVRCYAFKGGTASTELSRLTAGGSASNGSVTSSININDNYIAVFNQNEIDIFNSNFTKLTPVLYPETNVTGAGICGRLNSRVVSFREGTMYSMTNNLVISKFTNNFDKVVPQTNIELLNFDKEVLIVPTKHPDANAAQAATHVDCYNNDLLVIKSIFLGGGSNLRNNFFYGRAVRIGVSDYGVFCRGLGISYLITK